MKKHALTVGLHLHLKQVHYKIIQISEGKVTLEKLEDLSISRLDIFELLLAMTSGDLFIYGKKVETKEGSTQSCQFKTLSHLSNEELDEVTRKYAFIQQAISELGQLPTTVGLKNVIDKIHKKKPELAIPSKDTLYKWWKRYHDNGNDILSLCRRRSKKIGRSSFSKKVQDLIFNVIDNEYLIDTRPPIAHVYRLFVHHMDNINISSEITYRFPSRAQFYRIVKKLNQYEVTKARYGKEKADEIFRKVGKGPVSSKILERVEVDHTKLDVFVIDPDTQEVIGRPTLTVIIDCYSRMVLGVYIGFEPPSLLAVIRALKQAILPKNMKLDIFQGVENQWPAFGIPMLLVCDNGSEFHAKTFIGMCTDLGIDFQFCPTRRGSAKGTVERFIGRINREVCHLIPGTSFESISERADYDPEKDAAVTEKDLKRLIYRWLIDIYSHEINKNTLSTPFELWNKGLESVSPVLPECEASLSFCMTDEHHRKLTFKGIEIFNMFYQSQALKDLRHRKDSEFNVVVRADQEDISHIWVLDEQNDIYIKVPSIEPEYTNGLSLRQHKRIRKLCAEKGIKGRDAKATRAHRAALNEDIKSLKQSKKIRKKQKAAQLSQERSKSLNDLTSNDNKAKVVENTAEDLKISTFDIEEIK